MLRAAALALVLAATGVAAAHSAQEAAPSASTPLTIAYKGTFDLDNKLIPQGTQHSYDYHLVWSFAWTGRWGQLFPKGSVSSKETRFQKSDIVPGKDPNCVGGPQVDVFEQPADWNPLGEGGGSLGVKSSGTHHYDRTWRWRHVFAGGVRREYTSTMNSGLEIVLPRAKKR